MLRLVRQAVNKEQAFDISIQANSTTDMNRIDTSTIVSLDNSDTKYVKIKIIINFFFFFIVQVLRMNHH